MIRKVFFVATSPTLQIWISVLHSYSCPIAIASLKIIKQSCTKWCYNINMLCACSSISLWPFYLAIEKTEWVYFYICLPRSGMFHSDCYQIFFFLGGGVLPWSKEHATLLDKEVAWTPMVYSAQFGLHHLIKQGTEISAERQVSKAWYILVGKKGG